MPCNSERTESSSNHCIDIFDDDDNLSIQIGSYFDNEYDAYAGCLWAVPIQMIDGEFPSHMNEQYWGILLHLASPAAIGEVPAAEYHSLKSFRRVGCFVFRGREGALKLGWDYNNWLFGTATPVMIV